MGTSISHQFYITTIATYTLSLIHLELANIVYILTHNYNVAYSYTIVL